MLRLAMRSVGVLLAAAASLSAQVFVVDAANGPGTSFTEIATAAATVPGGATLEVRAGQYLPFSIDAKSLTVLAEAGVSVAGTTRVCNTLSSQSVTIRGIDFTAATPGTGVVVELEGCKGPVLLAQLTTAAALPPEPSIASYWFVPRGLIARRCDQLVVRDCVIAGVALSECDSVIEACVFRGASLTPTAGIPANAHQGLMVSLGRCEIVGASELIGGVSYPGGAQPAGLQALSTPVRVRSGRIEAGNGGPGWAVAAISAQVQLAPSVVLVSGGFPAFLGAVQVSPMPEVVSSRATPVGGTMQATVDTAVGELVGLFVGEVASPAWIAPLLANVWFDPAAAVLQGLGVQQASAPVSATVVVPNVAALRGASLVWQAVTLGPAGLSTSNPSVAIVQ